MLMTRNIVETTILRAPGLTYQENKNGTVSNLYNVQVLNKSYQTMPIQLKINQQHAQIKMIGKAIIVQPGEVAESSFFIEILNKSLTDGSVKIEIEVISDGKVIDHVKTKFLGPIL